MEKSAPLTLSEVGRVRVDPGPDSGRPRAIPAITRTDDVPEIRPPDRFYSGEGDHLHGRHPPMDERSSPGNAGPRPGSPWTATGTRTLPR
jgi:hypothetical protein